MKKRVDPGKADGVAKSVSKLGAVMLRRKLAMFGLVVVLLALTVVGCNSGGAAFTAGVLQGVSQANASGGRAPAAKMMIFGGPDHKTYLGCLTCSKFEADSVLNRYGEHGSPYSGESIWNRYSDYGSRYSSYGVCNRYATDPPVIVDSQGTFYGRLTLNRYHAQLGVGGQLQDWLADTVCAE